MKFTDGYWHVREGLQVLHPAEVEQVVAGARTLVVHSPTGRIRHRGDTLNRPVVTTTYSSPAPGVIRVRIDHLTGGVAPARTSSSSPRTATRSTCASTRPRRP